MNNISTKQLIITQNKRNTNCAILVTHHHHNSCHLRQPLQMLHSVVRSLLSWSSIFPAHHPSTSFCCILLHSSHSLITTTELRWQDAYHYIAWENFCISFKWGTSERCLISSHCMLCNRPCCWRTLRRRLNDDKAEITSAHESACISGKLSLNVIVHFPSSALLCLTTYAFTANVQNTS